MTAEETFYGKCIKVNSVLNSVTVSLGRFETNAVMG